ncbi:MAG TPA: response regulator [Gaiellaceae bacterium]|nr:response regulator [Gaiellaceae bacterium]
MSARVVVADDSELMRSLIQLALEPVGVEIAVAVDGDEALEVVREHRPEVLIVDASMPGLTGYEVCEALRADADGPRPYVLLLTADVRDSERQRAEEAGVDEFVGKPFSPLALAARVRELLGV